MILTELKTIAESNFITVPDDSFKTMQEDWKEEIQAMFEDLRAKEKASVFVFIQWCEILFEKVFA